jgi:hypothetical protein
MLLTAVQTGLRLSEITDPRGQDVFFGVGAHVRCEGKVRADAVQHMVAKHSPDKSVLR